VLVRHRTSGGTAAQAKPLITSETYLSGIDNVHRRRR
jgi:hypothetical protein